MKEYFRRSQRAPGGGGHGHDDEQGNGHGGPPELKHEYEHEHGQHRYPFFEGSASAVFRPRGGSGGVTVLPGLTGDMNNNNGLRREGSANDVSITSQEHGNGGVGVGEVGDGGAAGGIGASNGGVYGKNDHHHQQQQQQQQQGRSSNIMPWQHEMINGNGYQGGGSNPATDGLPPVSIGGGGGGGNHNISNDGGDGEDNGSSNIVGGGGAGGGADPGDVGSVEFDPQADCRPSVIGSHHNNNHANVMVSAGGGSPTSWWRDAPEPAASNFPWDLQLPNPAPPLALSSHTGGGGSGSSGGGGLQESSALGGVAGGRGGGSGGGGGPPASLMGGGSAGMSTIRGGGGSGGGATDHLRFGKPSPASLAGLGPAPSLGGGGHRHRGGGTAEQHLSQSGSALDILENGGNGGMRSGGSTILLDAVGRGPYGGSGGGGGGIGRWGSNASPPSATEIAWGLGSSRNGGGGAGENYLSARKLEESRRLQQAPPCDSLVPPVSHATAYNVVPANPRSLLHAGPLGGGSDRYGVHDFKSLSMASGDPEGVVFGRASTGGRGDMPRAKRARVMKREMESMHLSPSGSGAGLSSEEAAFSRLMDRNSGGGGGGGRSRGVAGSVGHGGHASMRDAAGSWGGGGSGRGRDGGGGGSSTSSRAPPRQKKAAASSRRCRDESEFFFVCAGRTSNSDAERKEDEAARAIVRSGVAPTCRDDRPTQAFVWCRRTRRDK